MHQEFQDKAKDKEVVSRRALRQSATFSWQGSATASLSTSMVEEEGEGADAGLGGEVDLATAAAAALEKQMVSQQMRRAYSQARQARLLCAAHISGTNTLPTGHQ